MFHFLYLQKKVIALIWLLSGICNIMRKYTHLIKTSIETKIVLQVFWGYHMLSMEIPAEKDKLRLDILLVLEALQNCETQREGK